MNLILDACSILNLLQVDMCLENGEYKLEYDYLLKLNKLDISVDIVQKVLDEVSDNYQNNLDKKIEKDFIKNYISKYLYSNLQNVNQKDFSSALGFTKKVTSYTKNNGELHSCAYALYLNRYGEKTNFFTTYFVTDDDKANDDFKKFFKVNLLGEIITTIDLLLILQINNAIHIREVIDFISNLKKHYMPHLNYLSKKLYSLQEQTKDGKESAFLTQFLEYINKLDFKQIEKKIVSNSLYKNIKEKDRSIDSLLRKILENDFKKVTILDTKLKEITSCYWTIDKI